MVGHGRLVLQWNDQLPAPGGEGVVLDPGALHEGAYLVGLLDFNSGEMCDFSGIKTKKLTGSRSCQPDVGLAVLRINPRPVTSLAMSGISSARATLAGEPLSV